jgi:hypothetical protein
LEALRINLLQHDRVGSTRPCSAPSLSEERSTLPGLRLK